MCCRCCVSLLVSKYLVTLQECAVAQNELLKEFLEWIQSRKKEVRYCYFSVYVNNECSRLWFVMNILSLVIKLPTKLLMLKLSLK